tara:strand:- start:38135 stop:38761 length:627 start_codon:yes stop_codon:yes gene_type:complete
MFRSISALVLLLQTALPLVAKDSTENFESFAVGTEPDLFILDGTFTVELDGGNKVLSLDPSPLVEGTVQIGKSLRTGAEITARVKGAQKRRSFPRFGVSLHGLSGYKLRVVPAKQILELVKNDEVIQTSPFVWSTDQWHVLRLRVQRLDDERWSVSGWVWAEATNPPEHANIEYIGEAKRFQGKAAIIGTPYSGSPILFDDVQITPLD